jgi:TonB family protein
MAQTHKQLVLNVVQAGKVRQFVIQRDKAFTIGQRGDNDLILLGQDYPQKYTLIYQKNGSYLINVRPFVDGNILTNGSTIRIRDLIQHGILPKNGENFILRLTPQNRGFLNIGDIKIEFEFKQVQVKPPITFDTSAFSWSRAIWRDLVSDLMFKVIFLIVFLLNALLIYAFKDYQVNLQAKFDIEKMPERLAKFIIKPPEAIVEVDSRAINNAMENSEEGQKSENKETQKSTNKKNENKTQGSNKPRGNPAASAGLLGLIAGTGTSGKSSSIVDALVDKGLVADLNKIVGGGTNLKVTKNGDNKDATDPLDQLIGTGGSGGIDDFLSALEDDVPQVELKKQAKVDLVKPSKITGSKEALGQRSEQSIWNIVSARQGAIRYIYEKYLKRNPNLRGKVTIEFTIAANGFITDAKITESTIDQPDFERELLALVKRLKFDPIPTGNLTTVFPFVFSKIN